MLEWIGCLFLVSTCSVETQKLSEALGHQIQKDLKPLELDLQSIVKGLQDAAEGKPAPLSEKEQQDLLKKLEKKKALCAAEQFLKENLLHSGIVGLRNGKLQIEITQPGEGVVLNETHSPLVQHRTQFLDEPYFSESPGDERVNLQEILPAMREGMLGMKEGETRKIFIHPDLLLPTEEIPRLMIVEIHLKKLGGTSCSPFLSELPSLPEELRSFSR